MKKKEFTIYDPSYGKFSRLMEEAQVEAALGHKVLLATLKGIFQIMPDGSKVPYDAKKEPPIIIIDEANEISEEIYRKIVSKAKICSYSRRQRRRRHQSSKNMV